MNGFLILSAVFAGIYAQETCEDGTWGDNCYNLCGKCKDNGACDKSTGNCVSTMCDAGYSGAGCNIPVCDAVSCGPDPNKCVAPNQCVCAKLYTQEYDETGARKGCKSLRADGLKGAGIAILVLIVSIIACKAGYKFSHP